MALLALTMIVWSAEYPYLPDGAPVPYFTDHGGSWHDPRDPDVKPQDHITRLTDKRLTELEKQYAEQYVNRITRGGNERDMARLAWFDISLQHVRDEITRRADAAVPVSGEGAMPDYLIELEEFLNKYMKQFAQDVLDTNP